MSHTGAEERNPHVRSLYRGADKFAEPFKVIIQFLIGLTLAALVVARGLKYLGVPIPFLEENPLEIVGKGLMVSAGIELAYMLFTEGPDEAVEPLILGLASAALIEVSRPNIGYEGAVVVGILCAAIAAMFYVRHLHPKRG